jgi:PAS domain S-box-containing protein
MHLNQARSTTPLFIAPSGGSRGVASPPGTKAAILIVDDNPAKTVALRSVVEELEYDVVVASSGDDALRELLKREFVLALLDVQMPEIDGFALAALIRSRPAHRSMAIVFMSAFDQTDERLENAYQLGAIDFIPLPARRQVIKAKLSSLLGLQEKARRFEMRASVPHGESVAPRDFAGEKHPQQELQIKAEVLESMSEGVTVVDDQLRMIYVNPAAMRIFGYAADEMVGSDVRMLNGYKPDEHEARVTALLSHLEHSKHWVGEWLNRRKDGTLFFSHTRVSVFAREGVRYFVSVQEDLTARKQAELAMQRNTQLQEIVTELEAFSYSVSHDLKSPLRSLRGFADAVMQDYSEALKGPGLHYMQRIRHATERLEQMVEDILTVSRMPREALVLAPVDLNHLIRALVEESAQFRSPHAQIELPAALPRVLGHAPSLRQVFYNLLANAVKFVPGGTKPRVTVRADIFAGEVTIWIEDNGIGVRTEDRERIFRAFERGNTAAPFPGTGVGLAIVKRAVERLGGTVGMCAGEEVGSRFWVKLALPQA